MKKLFRLFEVDKDNYQNRVTWYASGFIMYSIFIVVVCLICMAGCPRYNVWQAEMSGKAEMAKAEQNRKILIEEAKAKLEAEKLNAQSEIERAKGMAEAMEIENGKLTSTYNQYLFIRNLPDIAAKGSMPQFIYVPSEGFLPNMDLTRHVLNNK